MHTFFYDLIQQIGYIRAGGFFPLFKNVLLSLILVPILQLIYQSVYKQWFKNKQPTMNLLLQNV